MLSIRRAPILLSGLVLLSTLGTALAYPEAPCGRLDQSGHNCTIAFYADLGADDVVLSGEATLAGHPSGDGGNSRTGSVGDGSDSMPPRSTARPWGSSPGNKAIPPGSQVVVRDNYTVTSAPTVRLSDLVHFRPAPPIAHMEPGGWAVVGLDANFFATASRQVQQGSLLGRAASVRFTPVSYHWSYGDGGTRVTSAKGTTWVSAGLAEFSPTLTSHVYGVANSHVVSLTVSFAADYKFAGMSWVRLTGTVPARAHDVIAMVTRAKTVLVAH